MSAKRIALQKLSRRSYLSVELSDLLSSKGFNSKEIDEALEELTALGFLNDREWIAQAIRREIRAHHGPLRILAKLRFKGCDSDEVAALLEELYPEEARLAEIGNLINKLGDKDREKIIASVARKGFSVSEILKVCYNKV